MIIYNLMKETMFYAAAYGQAIVKVHFDRVFALKHYIIWIAAHLTAFDAKLLIDDDFSLSVKSS